jgi:hypothetical protein
MICGGGFGIHWPDIDADLNTAGLLRGRTGTAKQLGAIRHLTCKNL